MTEPLLNNLRNLDHSIHYVELSFKYFLNIFKSVYRDFYFFKGYGHQDLQLKSFDV